MNDPWKAGSENDPDLFEELPGQLVRLPFQSPGFCLVYLIAGLGLTALIVCIARLPVVLALLGGYDQSTSYHCGGGLGLALAFGLGTLLILSRLNAVGKE